MNLINIEDVVDYHVSLLYNTIVHNNFYIKFDSILNFVEFYVTYELYLKVEELNSYKSLKQLSEDAINKYEIHSMDKVSFYEQTQHCYSVMTDKTKEDHKLNKEKFMSSNSKEKSTKLGERYKGKKIYETVQKDFESLQKIYTYKKIDSNDYKLKVDNTTYKRLREKKSHNIKFDEYKHFVEGLKEDILESNFEYKGIQYYKIEKRMTYELIKTICANYVKIKEEDKNKFIKYTVLVANLPLIDVRHNYVDVYAISNEIGRDKCIREVEGLLRFINMCVENVMIECENLNLQNVKIEYNIEKFKRSYINNYMSKYKEDNDFKRKHFKEVVRKLQDIREEDICDLLENVYSF